jgi:hypothetical protein
MRSVPSLYNEEQLLLGESLEAAIRKVTVSCERLADHKDVNTEATALEAVTRRQPVIIQQTEKT